MAKGIWRFYDADDGKLLQETGVYDDKPRVGGKATVKEVFSHVIKVEAGEQEGDLNVYVRAVVMDGPGFMLPLGGASELRRQKKRPH